MKTITYAIGDVHGRADLLHDLLGLVEADADAKGARAKIVFTGDYMDRGADSFGVVERLIQGPSRDGDSFVCLRGNHDDLFVKAVAGASGLPGWVHILFRHTITGYGQDRQNLRDGGRDLERHVEFLRSLPLTHDDGTHLFVHAGIRPGIPLDRQEDEDLIWIRAEFLEFDGELPRRVVHGHTIMGDDPVVKPNRISIDTGAFRSGILTAAVIDPDDKLAFLQTKGEPDRGAIVREMILMEILAGREITAGERQAHADYEAGRIDLATMERRARLAALG